MFKAWTPWLTPCKLRIFATGEDKYLWVKYVCQVKCKDDQTVEFQVDQETEIQGVQIVL